MRLGVLRELKNVRKFFDMMEAGVKTRNPLKITRAYTFLKILVHHMDKGELTPLSIELYEALEQKFREEDEENARNHSPQED